MIIFVSSPMLKAILVFKNVNMKIKMLAIAPKIDPINIPFLFAILEVINAAKKRLIAPKIVVTWEIKVGGILEYKIIALKPANKIANMTKAAMVPKIANLKIFLNLNLSKLKASYTFLYVLNIYPIYMSDIFEK